MDNETMYLCYECGGIDIEEQRPAWFNINTPDDEKPVEQDSEAQPLAYWCNDCENVVSVLVPAHLCASGKREKRRGRLR